MKLCELKGVLLAGASAIVLMGAATAQAADQNLAASHTASATTGGFGDYSESLQDGSDDTNRTADGTALGFKGVASEVQNNGANAAATNGNTVSAYVAGSVPEGSLGLVANSSQSASVQWWHYSDEYLSNDRNTITDDAYGGAEGVISVLQNNGASAAMNNGNSVAAMVAPGGETNPALSASINSSQNASVAGGYEFGGYPAIENYEAESNDTNTIGGNAFVGASGVASVMQNNGAAAAANNGNSVAAVVGGNTHEATNVSINSGQSASVSGVFDNISTEEGSNNANSVGGNAFNSFSGVASVMQNNGANSAINGGNSVAAVISGCPSCTTSSTFQVASNQSAAVSGWAMVSDELNSTDTNTLAGNAFANSSGVLSVTQNNGANAALSNGNTVAAMVAN